jgi:germination protein M
MRRSIISILLSVLIALSGCSSSAVNNNNPAASIEPEKESAAVGKAVDKLYEPVESKIQAESIHESKGEGEDIKIPRESKAVAGAKAVSEVKEQPKMDQNQTIALTLYYQDKEGQLIPVTRRVAKQEGIARAAIAGLIDSAINREEIEFFGLYPVLPAGTEILGITIKDGTAVIDFSKELLNYNDEVAERNIISSIIYTLTEFKTVDNVKILVNGYLINNLKFGTDVSGNLSRETVMINSGSFRPEEGLGKVDIYLFKSVNDTMIYILPLSVEISRVGSKDVPSRIFEFLCKESNIEGLFSQLPSETRLLSSSINGTTLTLNFDEGLVSYGGGTAREQGIIEQILYSAKQIKGVEKVKILINGKTRELPEGYDISRAVSIPSVINDVVDK